MTPLDHPGLSAPTSARGRLQRQALGLLAEHRQRGELPTSARFLFYECVQRGFIPKQATGARRPDQNLHDALTQLRHVGLTPWSWLVDETRSVTVWESAPSVAAFLNAALDSARIDPWDGLAPLLVCESRTFGGVLTRTVGPEYLVPVTATNGQVGGFLRTDIAPLLERNARPILYVGDLDAQGLDIEQNTRAVLEQLTGERAWMRVALTPEQVEERGLEPIQKPDRRYRPVRVTEAVEVEALGQGVVTAMVREALDALLPEPLEAVAARERAEREALRDLLDGGA